jgi:hypothetical protein
MADRNNLLSLHIGEYKDVSLVLYAETGGWFKRRKLGPGRYAFDFGRVSLLFQNYSPSYRGKS